MWLRLRTRWIEKYGVSRVSSWTRYQGSPGGRKDSRSNGSLYQVSREQAGRGERETKGIIP